MTIPFEDWVLEAYRRIVVDAGQDAIKRDDAIGVLLPALEQAIADGDVVAPLDLERLVRVLVERDDDKRRRRQTDDVEHLRNVIGGNTILGPSDPWLDTVAVIGDGVRKAWRHVDTEDLYTMAARKSEHARQAVIAADDFLQAVTEIAAYLRRTHGPSAVVGDLA